MNLINTIIISVLVCIITNNAAGQSGNFKSYSQSEHSLIFESNTGIKLRFQFYSEDIIRIQWAQKGENFFANDHYEMVENHELAGKFKIEEENNFFTIITGVKKDIRIELQKLPMKYRIFSSDEKNAIIAENEGIKWSKNKIISNFLLDTSEHFCGMGHQAYGWVESIDLKGKTVSCNYGEGKVADPLWGPQGVLTVPFYLSNKGYGIFLNSTHYHSFNFGENNQYEFNINTKGFKGQMDYYFIYGPKFKDLLDKYTQLTGRPRLPQRSIFGLHLSDKGNPNHNGIEWWKNKITEHKNAGFPFDHMVNDNRWRSGSGAWSGSWFEWDSIRCPNPEEYYQWCKENHMTVTLDLNRNNAALCEGWKPEYNLPESEQYIREYGNSSPDYSNPSMRNWIWELFWKKSFNPALNYPGDALWIDETDNLWTLNDSLIAANGRSWAENENYYPFLIAKAIVQEGWDNKNNNSPPGIGESKRPYVWVRSMCAGAQRYATHWTGDLKSNYNWMKANIRALQTSGLAGFPYFNHDAGGFRPPGPDDNMYIRWSMAFGSLTPIWRPHGKGKYKRWPLDRSETCQVAAMKYGKMRYQMMPYIYTYAYNASQTGMPMARAMVIDYQYTLEAWKFDLQYMWGNELLIAPVCSAKDTSINIWLPEGQNWYHYWSDKKVNGDQVIKHKAKLNEIPIFVKEGSIIPTYNYSQSTFTLDASELIVDVYTGKNANFTLYEDDGVSEKFKTKNEKRTTKIEYKELANKLVINAVEGNYKEAISDRSYKICFHGIENIQDFKIYNKKLKIYKSQEEISEDSNGIVWDKSKKVLIVFTKDYSINDKIVISK